MFGYQLRFNVVLKHDSHERVTEDVSGDCLTWYEFDVSQLIVHR